MTQSSRWTVAILCAIAAVHLAGVNDHWAMKPDSGLYMSLGRSLAEGRGMEFNGKQFWGVPPVVPFLIAGCRLLTGDHFWLINLVMALAGLGVVLLSFLTVRRLCADLPEGRRTGLVLGVTLAVGLSARLYIDSTRILTDVPFALLVMLGLYAFVRGSRGHWLWYLGGSLALAAATYTRMPGLVVGAGAVAAVLLDFRREGYGRQVAAALGGAALLLATFLVWLLVIQPLQDARTIDYTEPLREGYFNLLSAAKWVQIGESLVNFPSALCSSITYQKLTGGYLNLLPTALLIVGAVTMARRRQWAVLLPAAFYAGFLIVFHPTAVASRYMLPVMPVTVYGILLGVQTLADWRRRGPAAPPDGAAAARPRAAWSVVIAAALLAGISVPRIAQELYWMRHPQFYEAFEGGEWKPYIEAGRYLKEHGHPETDTCLTPQGTILHYFSRLRLSEQIRLYHGREDNVAPAAFAEAVAKDPARFVLVPGTDGAWGRAAAAHVEATGLFEAPPVTFGNLALYERRETAPGEPPPDQDAGRPTAGG
ncbi:MAG: glycosyltransferase family 39 protein [Planctomycetes bacterium]|nr:glycosyltransferase family 39 protein [Planctomycetota bacterium]